MGRFYVYIMTNRSRTLYIGVTNDLERRVVEHREKRLPGFTARYNLDILIHYEEFTDVVEAIAREATERLDAGEEDRSDPRGESSLGGPRARLVRGGAAVVVVSMCTHHSIRHVTLRYSEGTSGGLKGPHVRGKILRSTSG